VTARVAVEAGVSLGWDRWVGWDGAIVGLDHFGASAPAGTIFKEFGFTVDRVTAVARGVLDGSVRGPQPTLAPGHLPAPSGDHHREVRPGGDTPLGGEPAHGGNGSHPSLGSEDPGVDRSGSSDPGHS
jgi:hypothetical protein